MSRKMLKLKDRVAVSNWLVSKWDHIQKDRITKSQAVIDIKADTGVDITTSALNHMSKELELTWPRPALSMGSTNKGYTLGRIVLRVAMKLDELAKEIGSKIEIDTSDLQWLKDTFSKTKLSKDSE